MGGVGTYFHNDLKVERGQENIKAYNVREGCLSTNYVATCCHSTLVIDNPFYKGTTDTFNVCCALSGLCKIEPASTMRPRARLCEGEWLSTGARCPSTKARAQPSSAISSRT